MRTRTHNRQRKGPPWAGRNGGKGKDRKTGKERRGAKTPKVEDRKAGIEGLRPIRKQARVAGEYLRRIAATYPAKTRRNARHFRNC